MLIAINVNENNLDLCIYLSFVKLVTKLNCYKIVFNFIYFTQNIYYVIRGTLKKYILYTKGYRKAGLIQIKNTFKNVEENRPNQKYYFQVYTFSEEL